MKDNLKDRIKELIKSGKHEDMIDCAISNLIWIAENFSEAKSAPITTLNKLHDIGFELKRIATPKKKPVDMSVFVGSPVDCEFSQALEAKYWNKGCLDEIGTKGGVTYVLYQILHYLYCKPRMNYPFSVKLWSNAEQVFNFMFDLKNAGFNSELIDNSALMITGVREGFCWPWEV